MLGRLGRVFTTMNSHLTPSQLCFELDKFIIGQADAKRAVAVALRTRWRRLQLTEDQRVEVTPKNILMIGPTGCGKTEIARRLAKFCGAPFIKVEATKFTEVGYHGRDVDEIIKDLVNVSIHLVKENIKKQVKGFTPQVEEAVVEYIVDHLMGVDYPNNERRKEKKRQVASGELDERIINVEFPDVERLLAKHVTDMDKLTFQEYLAALKKYKPGRMLAVPREPMTIKEARTSITNAVVDGFKIERNVIKEAIKETEESGVVFIDEIDKIASPADSIKYGTSPSSEGVQRDLLPLIEGTVVNTKHGDVRTDHILFIACGAFTETKPSDLLAELQGRLPVRVVLKTLDKHDFKRILTEPQNSILKQHSLLMRTEGIELIFDPSSIDKIAEISDHINKNIENTGARRLHTVLEKLLEDISYSAPDMTEREVTVTAEMVMEKVQPLLQSVDLRKHLL